MLACEACGTPLLTTGRDCCHLLSLPPHRDTVCMAQPGLQPSRSSSSPACPIPRLLEHSLCHPAMLGATEAIHSQSTSQTGHLCHVQVPIQESFPYPPAESQILHLYLCSFKAASFLWAALGRKEKHAQALFPLILGEQGSSSKCEFVVLHFPAFLITEGFGKGEVGTSQRELTYPCPDRLLITGAVSSISVKTSKSVSINAKQNQEQWHSSHKSNKVFCFYQLEAAQILLPKSAGKSRLSGHSCFPRALTRALPFQSQHLNKH